MWLQSPRVSAQNSRCLRIQAPPTMPQAETQTLRCAVHNSSRCWGAPADPRHIAEQCIKRNWSYLIRAVEPGNDILNSSQGACSAQVLVSTPARKTSVQWIVEVQEVCPWKSLHHVRHSACMLVSSLVRLFCHELKNFRDSTAFLYVQNLRHASHPWALQPTCDVRHDLQPSVPSVLNRGEY